MAWLSRSSRRRADRPLDVQPAEEGPRDEHASPAWEEDEREDGDTSVAYDDAEAPRGGSAREAGLWDEFDDEYSRSRVREDDYEHSDDGYDRPAPWRGAPPHGADSSAPGLSLGRAVLRYPLALALPVSLLLFGALALGLTRAPAYKSSASLYVGKLDVASQAIPGYVTAATTLASAYSRIVESRQVLVPVAAQLGKPYSAVAGRVTASPIPDSPVFRITGEAGSAADAIRLTRAVTSRISAYVEQASRVSGGSDAILARYRTAARAADRLRLRLARLQARSGTSPGAVSPAELEAARVASQAAVLQVQTLGGAYANSLQNARGATITLLNPATTATSDRQSVVQRLAFIGFFGGLVIGVALAVLLYNRRVARERRAE